MADHALRLPRRRGRTDFREVGYDDAIVDRVEDLLRKKQLKSDAEMQLLEDVICLVFLENYFSDFARQKDETAMITIVQKTWKKMSARGHQAALELPFRPPIGA